MAHPDRIHMPRLEGPRRSWIGPGSALSSSGHLAAAQPSTFKRGGKVRKGGMALVHKGERVLTKRQSTRKR